MRRLMQSTGDLLAPWEGIRQVPSVHTNHRSALPQVPSTCTCFLIPTDNRAVLVLHRFRLSLHYSRHFQPSLPACHRPRSRGPKEPLSYHIDANMPDILDIIGFVVSIISLVGLHQLKETVARRLPPRRLQAIQTELAELCELLERIERIGHPNGPGADTIQRLRGSLKE